MKSLSRVQGVAERIFNRARALVVKMVDRTKEEVRDLAVDAQEPVSVDGKDTQNYISFNVRAFDRARIQGAEPWDIKPGLLTSARVKRSKKGDPYIDVPIHLNRLSNAAQVAVGLLMAGDRGIRMWMTKSNPGRALKGGPMKGQGGRAQGSILFRRVSLKSAASSWIHPGFGGAESSGPRRFGTTYGPDKPGFSDSNLNRPLFFPGPVNNMGAEDSLKERLKFRARQILGSGFWGGK